jgi:hypothetical protein
MATEKIFPNGFFVNAPREGAPEFVLGSISISVESFNKFILENKNLINDKGYLRLDMLNGKEDKPYAVVNTYGLDSVAKTKEETPLHVDSDLPF